MTGWAWVFAIIAFTALGVVVALLFALWATMLRCMEAEIATAKAMEQKMHAERKVVIADAATAFALRLLDPSKPLPDLSEFEERARLRVVDDASER